MININSLVSHLLGSNTESEEIKNNLVVSLLSNGRKRTTNDDDVHLKDNVFINDVARINHLLSYLEEFPLVETIINLISSTLKDIIKKSSFIVTVQNDEESTKDSNDFLNKIELRQLIKNDLKQMLYYGSYFYYVNYYDPSDKSKVNIRRVVDPFSLIAIEEYTKPCGYLIPKLVSDPSSISTNIGGHEKLKVHEVISFMYNKTRIKKVSEQEKKNIYNGIDTTDSTDTTNKDDSYVLQYEYLVGKSIFAAYINLIFRYFLLDLLKSVITIKSLVSTSIVKANITGSKSTTSEIASSIENIESLLNDVDFNVLTSTSDIQSSIIQLLSYAQNNIKVIPGIDNVSTLEHFPIPGVSDRIQAINDELEKLEPKILNYIGIPQELYEGTSNRWEIMSRSNKYLTIIEDYLDTIVYMVKSACKTHIKYKNNKDINIEDISLNLDSSNILLNTAINNRSEIISKKITNITDIFKAAKEWIETYAEEPLSINKEKSIRYIKAQIASIDTNISDLFNDPADETTTDTTKNNATK